MIKQLIKFLILFAILLTGCSADLHTKRLALNHLKDNGTVTLVDGFVELSYTENRGMVFGLLNENHSTTRNIVLSTLTFISILFMCVMIWRFRNLSFIYHLPFFIILSGAIPNLMDRVRFGRVVDFIHIHWKDSLDWPFLFNVADALICVGGFLLLVLMIFKRETIEKVSSKAAQPPP